MEKGKDYLERLNNLTGLKIMEWKRVKRGAAQSSIEYKLTGNLFFTFVFVPFVIKFLVANFVGSLCRLFAFFLFQSKKKNEK